MTKTLIGAASCIFLIAHPVWGQDALHFYNRGLESSMTNRKIHYFSKALELNPRLSIAYQKRGLLYFFQGKHVESMQDFLRVAELEPSQSEAHLMLGLLHMNEGNYDEAVGSLNRATELDPQLASAYSHRAEAYRLKGMVQQAIEDSTRAINLGGTDQAAGRAYTTRAKAYRQLGRSKLADADFEKAYKLDPDNYVYRYFTITNHLASFVSDSGGDEPERMRTVGLAGIIALLLIVVFKLALPMPKKGDQG